ncbi:hypothetical protein [Streptomyces sp. NPDC048106]|uniref:hypothetical protein n=1 Tax=Streptomyces sp. NPDC048106 TaxID=3155750 RepID=UPI003456D15C
MALDKNIAKLAHWIRRESGDAIPFQQAWLSAASQFGALPVHTMAPQERIPLRIQYTGESDAAAQSAIDHDTHGLGLDHCSDDQRAFRALLALALFNGNVYTGPTARWNYAVVAAYDPVMSPRRDQLVMVAERAPENVATRLLPVEVDGSRGIPGLRHEVSYTCHGQQSLCLRHLPTGAMLTITGDPDACRRGSKRSFVPRHRYPTIDHKVTEHERRALAAVPPMSHDATALLAGLVPRYNLVDRRGRWATSLSWDPLERPGSEHRREPDVRMDGAARRLWGSGDSWVLRWNGFPEPHDLAIALTHREVGIKGARLTRHGGTFRVTLGTASLELSDEKG